MLQYNQDKRSGPGLAGYMIWKLDTKLAVLQLKNLRVDQRKELYIRLTQENSIKNSVQDHLPYILY